MRKLLSFIVGTSLGAVAGVILVSLFSPVSGEELKANLRQHYVEALGAARKASAEKRAQLEKELLEMKNR